MCVKFHRLVCVSRLPQVIIHKYCGCACVNFHRLLCNVYMSTSTSWCVYAKFHRLVCLCQLPQVGVYTVYMPSSTGWCAHVSTSTGCCVRAYPRRCLGVGGRCVQFYSKRQSNAILPFFLPSFVTRTSGAALQCL